MCIINPTGQPSSQPSTNPSGQPTSQPTQPTGQPTSQPSAQPVCMPTSLPSGQPSSQPSGQPSLSPTSNPSNSCEVGTYLTDNTPDRCVEVEKGHCASVDGESCIQSDSMLATSQAPCKVGFFSTERRSLICDKCNEVKTTTKEGSSYCDSCIAGYSEPLVLDLSESTTSTGCSPCIIGFYKGLGTGSCTQCPSGHTTKGTKGVDISACTICLTGYGFDGVQCVVCDIGYYSNEISTGPCTICPSGRITPARGATALDQCLSPETNFYIGFVVIGLIIPVFLEYLVDGRYHRISFLRKERDTNRLVEESRNLSPQLYYYVPRADMDKVRNTSKSLLKTWRFLIVSCLLIGSVISLYFLSTLGSIFFKSLILWKDFNISLDLDMDFILHIIKIVEDFASFLHFPWLKHIFVPFEYFFRLFANLSINLEFINVTCVGASAPMELLINLVIAGICIIIIESDFQLFRSLTFNRLTDVFLLGLTQPSYKSWVCSERGTMPMQTQAGKKIYYSTIIIVIVVRAIGGINFFQAFMQFLMTFFQVAKFAEVNGRHASSPACNQVEGFQDFDDYIAIISSYEAYLMVVPVIYEVTCILVPGIPTISRELRRITKDANAQKNKVFKTTVLHFLKYSTIISPELVLSEFAASWLSKLDTVTRKTYTRNAQLSEKTERLARYIRFIVVSKQPIHVYDAPAASHGTYDVRGSLQNGTVIETKKNLCTKEIITSKGALCLGPCVCPYTIASKFETPSSLSLTITSTTMQKAVESFGSNLCLHTRASGYHLEQMLV